MIMWWPFKRRQKPEPKKPEIRRPGYVIQRIDAKPVVVDCGDLEDSMDAIADACARPQPEPDKTSASVATGFAAQQALQAQQHEILRLMQPDAHAKLESEEPTRHHDPAPGQHHYDAPGHHSATNDYSSSDHSPSQHDASPSDCGGGDAGGGGGD